MRIPVKITDIAQCEILRYLNWRGQTIDDRVKKQIDFAVQTVLDEFSPAALIRRFPLEGACFAGTTFIAKGEAPGQMLAACSEAALFAATLGAESERALLRIQAKSHADALVADAVFSAAIEAVCDQACAQFEAALENEGLFATRRFSPGYGDMPLEQSREICEILKTQSQIGLCVSSNGIMIPRKSVCAVIGITTRRSVRPREACASCSMKSRCTMRKTTSLQTEERDENDDNDRA